jgi:hypothetical protein
MNENDVFEVIEQAYLNSNTWFKIWNPEVKIKDINKFLVQFASLIAEKEREECALICNKEWAGTSNENVFATKIRARGAK